ncbi:nuclease-related domain-containing protein [Psychrobacillus vulpis]|uniref:NERD domain-containing protein n=1 Tax=Psychrobacillus vulpis TaxID=2325572 RepID=A0A544TJP1_9BACI|nr:nuclease-related domain-containing protein [Psychrobacillus vulpis]TQR17670.1 NERD domain-containing protein [Psychrobacillus vulpis]
MIIKKRSMEYKYMGLKMLYKRLPKEHAMKSIINSNILSTRAGIIGESKLEEIFDKYHFPFDYCVLHDVSMTSTGKFQIDVLFITPYYVAILECKNIIGELCFENEPSCLIRKLEDQKKDVFESPEIQVDRNKYLLKEWLTQRDVFIPVIGVIVLSSMKSRVVKKPNHTPVIYTSSIPTFLRNLPRKKEYISVTKMYEIAKLIMLLHRPFIPYPMCKNWGIDPRDLITGVKCEKCDQFGMVKIHRGWHCLTCMSIDRLAHEQTVREWFALVGKHISNKDCRNFLQIESHQLASRILNSMNLKRRGSSKNNTIYTFEWEKLNEK